MSSILTPETKTPIESKKHCHLAWHITSRCNLTCRHCLRHTPDQALGDLSTEECREILRSFFQFAQEEGRGASVELSGGNPLLREDFSELLASLGEQRRDGVVDHIRILANPETMDEAMVDKFAEANVDAVYISLDGLEETNDAMRGPGSFRAGVEAIRALSRAGLSPRVKFTLLRDNADQLVEVMKLALDEGVRFLGVGSLIRAGGGYRMREHALTPADYRELLLKLLLFLDAIAETHEEFRATFIRFMRLFALLFHEHGRLDEYVELTTNRRSTIRGPVARGEAIFVVWSDGEVVLRREMQRQGWVPRQSFREIYDNSYLMPLMEDGERLRQLAREAQSEYVRCRFCPVAEHCLPSLVGFFGGRPFFAPNELCWR